MSNHYEHVADQKPAGDFVEGTFRRTYPKSFPAGVTAIVGIGKETVASGKSDANARQIQSIRFDSAAWTPAKAREWLNKCKYSSASFEAATDSGTVGQR